MAARVGSSIASRSPWLKLPSRLLGKFWIFYALICFLPTPSIHASNPRVRLSQLEHSTWRLQDGVFNGAPLGIAQTKDGYLWIGTIRGLVRFDGVRFVPWRPPEKQILGSLVIRSLLAARDGSLWIGTSTGLAHWTNGELISFPGSVAYIESIFESRDGTIWITRSRIRDWSGPICKVEGLKLHCYGKSDGIASISAHPIVEDTQGNLWFGGSGALIKFNVGIFKSFPLPGIAAGDETYSINGIAIDLDGSVWAGLNNVDRRLGLENFLDGRWKAFSVSGFDGSAHEITTLFRDRDGCLWVGTEHSGIYRINGNQVDSFDRADGLSSNNVTGFRQDSEGDLWVTTVAGLDVFRGRPVVTYTSREGLSADSVNAVLARNDGSIWMSNANALDSLFDGKVKSIGTRSGLPGRSPSALLEDRQGRLWLGVDKGLFVYTNGKFQTIISTVVHGGMISLAQDLNNDIWAVLAGPSPKLIRIRDLKVQEEFLPPDVPAAFSALSDQRGGIWINLLDSGLVHLSGGVKDRITLAQFNFDKRGLPSIFNLHVEEDGTLWGASNRGLIGYLNGRWNDVTDRNGLPCNSVYSVISDKRNAIWLYSRCGLVRIDRDELERWWMNPDSKIRIKVFDAADGMQGGAPVFRPAATRSEDGRLWFANTRGVLVIDPDHLETNQVSPPVNIEELIADEHAVPLSGKRILPALTRQIEIQYTALSFVLPGRVRFRYQLEGYEKGWQEPGNRRTAFYSNLNPGDYKFHVMACNNDGLWNTAGATLTFSVAAAFYQTYWFRAISLIATVVLLWQLYLLRLKQATEQVQARMGERLAERERIARELHDTLLQGFNGIVLRFEGAMKKIPSQDPARELMEKALSRADEVLLEGRSRVRDLRSETPDSAELEELITNCGEELSGESSIAFSLAITGTAEPLNPIARDEAYRIAREALLNAFHHSMASKIEVEITYDHATFHLRVRDDGCGIDPTILTDGRPGHWGLSGIRERAQNIGSRLHIWSKSGAGTEIELTIPSRIAYRRNQQKTRWRWLKVIRKGKR